MRNRSPARVRVSRMRDGRVVATALTSATVNTSGGRIVAAAIQRPAAYGASAPGASSLLLNVVVHTDRVVSRVVTIRYPNGNLTVR
jgi:hypothetical protein